MTRKSMLLLLSALFVSCGFFVERPASTITLPSLFSDHMVLQQNKPVTIWGKADPGHKVTVRLAAYERWTLAGRDSLWRVSLPSMNAGGPYTLSVSGESSVTFEDVLIGEVWICSGQSNMEMPLAGWGKINHYEQEIAGADYPEIRLLTVPRNLAYSPQDEAETDGWRVCTPATIPEFSAVGYFFGRDIHESREVPVGLINTTWGGTVVEAWTSGRSLIRNPDFSEVVTGFEAKPPHSMQYERKTYEDAVEAWEASLTARDRGFSSVPWYAPSLRSTDWPVMQLPVSWEEAGLAGFDGFVWFRRQVYIPDSWLGEDIRIELGPIDDDDETWFNGVKLGGMKGWTVDRKYTIPARILRPGLNSVAVRVFDGNGAGGIYGDADKMRLVRRSGSTIPLGGQWRYQTGLSTEDMPQRPANPDNPNRATLLYNAMIAPLVPYTIRGAIWYQGESNAGRAYQYRTLFPTLIRDWRARWKDPFPFYFVQLANFRAHKTEPSEDDWAELREAQTMTLGLPGTGMAVAIDIGDAGDIHPKNKQDVGRRLALIARNRVYGEAVPYSGPLYRSMAIEKNRIRIHFDHSENGLKARGDALQGFAIAGEDRKFEWADAVIEGETVVVSSENIPNPVAVRYAWQANPVCNLYNSEGLPASPFRTDKWPGITAGKK